jgi:hypothetical protein
LNESINAPLNTTLHIYAGHTNGTALNITWDGSIDNGTTWFYLGSHNSVYNGTYSIGFWNASNLDTMYYWRIVLEDVDGNFLNATYHYTTVAVAAVGNQVQLLGQGNIPLTIMTGLLFVLPFGLLFMIIGNRKKQKEEKETDDRANNIFNP